jgi:hypothetical protein
MSIRKVIEIDDEPQLLRILTAIRDGREPVRLRRAGEDLAIVTPVYANLDSSGPRRIQTSDELAAFLSTAGGWADADTDALVEDMYRQRLVSTRSPVDLLPTWSIPIG